MELEHDPRAAQARERRQHQVGVEHGAAPPLEDEEVGALAGQQPQRPDDAPPHHQSTPSKTADPAG